MLQVCRTCLQEIADLNYISLGDATSLTDSLKVKDVLSIFVPELALDIITDPVMCASCMTSLHIAYDFKQKCLRTEERIRSYVHSLVLGTKDVSIIAMVSQDNDDKKDALDVSDGEATLSKLKMEKPNWLETSQLEICIKEEPHSSDDEAMGEFEAGSTCATAEEQEEAALEKFIYSNLANSWKEDVSDKNPGPEPHDTDSGLSCSNADSNLNSSGGGPVEGHWLRRALESPRKQHECDTCKKIFDRRSSLYLHKKIHEEDRPFKCTKCNYSATQRINLITHMRGHTGEKPYNCNLCDFRTAHHSSIKHHTRVHTGKKAYPCSECDFSSSFKSFLVAHSKVHEDQNPFKCDECGFRTNREEALLEHIKSHTDSSRRCTRCNFVAEHAGELATHLKNHGRQKRFKCNECDYSTTVKCNLQRHQVVHTGQKTLKCTACGYATSTSSRLCRHMRMHAANHKLRLYKCKECSFTSSEEKKIRIHIKIHSTGERPFKCTECEYTASCRMHVIKHMRTHTGEKPYKCDLCDFTASHNFSLKRHMTVHSDEKPFKCSMCNYTAKRRTYLLDHIRTHTGEKPYKCAKCSYSASRRPLLLTHLLTVHEEQRKLIYRETNDLSLVIDTNCSRDENISDLDVSEPGQHEKVKEKIIEEEMFDNDLVNAKISREANKKEEEVFKRVLNTNLDTLT